MNKAFLETKTIDKKINPIYILFKYLLIPLVLTLSLFTVLLYPVGEKAALLFLDNESGATRSEYFIRYYLQPIFIKSTTYGILIGGPTDEELKKKIPPSPNIIAGIYKLTDEDGRDLDNIKFAPIHWLNYNALPAIILSFIIFIVGVVKSYRIKQPKELPAQLFKDC